CWILMRRGRAPIASMGLALLAFSMTTLWPVFYIYFDVFLLFAAGVLADMPFVATRSTARSVISGSIAVAAAATIIVGLFGAAMLRARASEPARVSSRNEPPTASVLLLRQSASAATVDIELAHAFETEQQVHATLNGAPLGGVMLASNRVLL